MGSPRRVTSKRGALEALLARFPERGTGDPDADPLLPPAIQERDVIEAVLALSGREAATGWLAQIATLPPVLLRVAALRALAREGPGADRRSSPQRPEVPDPSSPAARAVQASLHDGDLRVRRAALEACGALGRTAVPEALEALETTDVDLRNSAARCLGLLHEPRAVEPLLARLRAERSLEAARALARIGDRRATPLIVALLKEDGPTAGEDERALLVRLLGELGDSIAAPALEQELAHPAEEVRLAAAEALIRAGRPASGEALAICRQDYSSRVRRACDDAYARLHARPGR